MMDHEKIKEGVRLMLEGIGEDVNREGLLETPDRIARMCEQIYGGLYEDAGVHLSKQFHATNNNIVLEKDITFYSTCEHHLLPFYGKAHVAYIPDQRVAGLSKLARTVEVYARRPQIQENMTAPYGGVEQDDFLNGALALKTLLTPQELLERLHEIEQEAHRERLIHWGPRTLDLDILLYDDLVLDTPDLIIPHVEMHLRDFVLIPLAQIAPWKRHPVLGLTVSQMLADLQAKQES